MFAFAFIPVALLGIGPYSGLDGHTAVAVPRLEGTGVVIDGTLSEPVWSQAAVLCGFSQYAPVDGRPADDSTEVLVWYSRYAIYFGIRAFERHGAVHAALANRDRIANDDWVEIFLDTFNDRRQALVFGVNPLGVQADGTLIETQAGSRDTVDFSADFVYQSQGRLTATGFEVEIRIPFKSIRYQSQAVQQWGFNVVRQVQHSGHRETWTAARLAAASFLAQSGTLTGLTDLHRGLVLDAIPEFTAKVDGARGTTGWSYGAVQPDAGGNLRWGVTNNLTLTATARPDFSQVEADAGQLVSDPREALFFPEKRPFFLEGLEQFNTPNSLVYTRRLVQPVAAIKLTGKVSGLGIGLFSAVDDRASPTSETNPVYNILRLRRDLGGQSTAGLVYTDKIDGPDYNRVAGANARIVFGGTHTAAFQAVESFTRGGGATVSAPLWYASLDRTGRRFGYTYSINAIAPNFVAASGFISRPGLAVATIDHHVTRYGRPGAAVESWTGDVLVRGRWAYPHLMSGRVPDDQFLHFTSTWQVRGWTLSAAFYLESFGFDSAYYSSRYKLQHTAGGVTDTVPFIGTPRIPNYDFLVDLHTPQFRRFNASLLVLPALQDENFFEWAPAWIIFIQAGLDWRPSDRIRVNATYLHQQYWRKTDGTTVGRDMIPRVKVEYQVARPLFVRVVGEYAAHWQDSLRDDSRTDDPILIRDPDTGVYVRAGAKASNALRLDWLASFTPSPGTVLYAGYGSSLAEAEPFAFRGIHRVRDGFFVKVTYLIRAP